MYNVAFDKFIKNLIPADRLLVRRLVMIGLMGLMLYSAWAHYDYFSQVHDPIFIDSVNDEISKDWGSLVLAGAALLAFIHSLIFPRIWQR